MQREKEKGGLSKGPEHINSNKSMGHIMKDLDV